MANAGAHGSIQLFSKFDRDRSGLIDFEEFYELLLYYKYPTRLTRSRAMDIFVKADVDHDNFLSRAEFENGVKYMQTQIEDVILAGAGLAERNKFYIIAGMTSIIALFFVFIFMGIVAFTTPGGFTSSLNALLPIIAGLSTSRLTIFSKFSSVRSYQADSLKERITTALTTDGHKN